MDLGTYAIIFLVGACALALWFYYRMERFAPSDLRTAAIHIGAALVACQLLAPAVSALLRGTDIQVLRGTAQPATQSQQSAASGVLSHQAGRTLVALAGLVVLGFGIGMAIYGAKVAFRDKLNLASARHAVRTVVLNLGRIGYLAKGLAIGIVGALLIDVALTDREERSRGLDGALRTLAGQPYGRTLLALIAAGFGAFGIYCFAQSRYRRI